MATKKRLTNKRLESLSLKITELRKKAKLQVPDLSNLSDDELLQRLSVYYAVGIRLDLTPDQRKFFDDVYNLLTEAGINPTDTTPQELITHDNHIQP